MCELTLTLQLGFMEKSKALEIGLASNLSYATYKLSCVALVKLLKFSFLIYK